jgi:hypothetical protein
MATLKVAMVPAGRALPATSSTCAAFCETVYSPLAARFHVPLGASMR